MKDKKITLLIVAVAAVLAVVVTAVSAILLGHYRTPSADSSAAAAQAPAAVPISSTDDSQWPHKITSGDTTVLFYDPQVQKWSGDEIEGFAAVGVETGGAQAQTAADQQQASPDGKQTYGEIFFTAHAALDKQNRTVTLDHFKVTKADFPTAPDKTSFYLAMIQQTEGNKVQVVPQDHIQSDLAIADAEHKNADQLRNDPPRIIFSSKPAVLVLVDGQPVLRPAGLGSLQRVINTRAVILMDQGSNTYYLSLMNGWAQASSPEGPWTFARSVPADANRVKTKLAQSGQVDLLTGEGEANEESTDQAEAQTASEQGPPVKPSEPLSERVRDGRFPIIYVSTVPAELLTATGDPQFKPVPGTGLLYVVNSGNQIFMNTANQSYYVLISGRWFMSKSLDGPWTYVDTQSLPADFAKIPEGDQKASVLASVAGTPAAREAAIENRVPQMAAINRADAHCTVTYDHDPQFQPIAGTHLQYAVNSATPVIEVAPASYLAVQDGVWFDATTPLGPWVVATSVPPDVYAIPPSCPVYNTTFVRVYGFTPEVVYDGFTPGYYGTVIAPNGLVVYGTGLYYPPYIADVWYGWPWTYGLGVGFGWSPFYGWGFGFGAGFLTPVYSPWWGPFAFGAGFPRWGFGFGFGGVGWGGGFGFRPAFAWGGLRPFNAFGRWGGSALIATHAGWAGGRFAGGARVAGFRGGSGAIAARGTGGTTGAFRSGALRSGAFGGRGATGAVARSNRMAASRSSFARGSAASGARAGRGSMAAGQSARLGGRSAGFGTTRSSVSRAGGFGGGRTGGSGGRGGFGAQRSSAPRMSSGGGFGGRGGGSGGGRGGGGFAGHAGGGGGGAHGGGRRR